MKIKEEWRKEDKVGKKTQNRKKKNNVIENEGKKIPKGENKFLKNKCGKKIIVNKKARGKKENEWKEKHKKVKKKQKER